MELLSQGLPFPEPKAEAAGLRFGKLVNSMPIFSRTEIRLTLREFVPEEPREPALCFAFRGAGGLVLEGKHDLEKRACRNQEEDQTIRTAQGAGLESRGEWETMAAFQTPRGLQAQPASLPSSAANQLLLARCTGDHQRDLITVGKCQITLNLHQIPDI